MTAGSVALLLDRTRPETLLWTILSRMCAPAMLGPRTMRPVAPALVSPWTVKPSRVTSLAIILNDGLTEAPEPAPVTRDSDAVGPLRRVLVRASTPACAPRIVRDLPMTTDSL